MTHNTHRAGIRRVLVVATEIAVEPSAVEQSRKSQPRSLKPLAAPSMARAYPIGSLLRGQAKANG